MQYCIGLSGLTGLSDSSEKKFGISSWRKTALTRCPFISTIQNRHLQSPEITAFDSYLIFVIFSPRAQFLAQFFSTQKRVNRAKTNFAKNSVNRHKTDFTTKNRVNFRFLHICHVEKCEIPPNLAKFHISPHLKFLYMWRNFTFLHTTDVKISEIHPVCCHKVCFTLFL